MFRWKRRKSHSVNQNTYDRAQNSHAHYPQGIKAPKLKGFDEQEQGEQYLPCDEKAKHYNHRTGRKTKETVSK